MTDDIISRAAALKGLEDLNIASFYEENEHSKEAYTEVKAMLKALPSAQPEIMRCKDCKYNPNPPECGNAACVLFYGMTDQMGFCHHGERREQDETD